MHVPSILKHSDISSIDSVLAFDSISCSFNIWSSLYVEARSSLRISGERAFHTVNRYYDYNKFRAYSWRPMCSPASSAWSLRTQDVWLFQHGMSCNRFLCHLLRSNSLYFLLFTHTGRDASRTRDLISVGGGGGGPVSTLKGRCAPVTPVFLTSWTISGQVQVDASFLSLLYNILPT